jgi:hypothetical protein
MPDLRHYASLGLSDQLWATELTLGCVWGQTRYLAMGKWDGAL